MEKTVFIADLHLDEVRGDINQLFFDLLASFADQQVKRCYILGDLFEYWLGDDCQTPLTKQVAEKIRHAAEAGCQFYFIHGNRDFLLRSDYANLAQMTLLAEHEVIDLYGTQTLIAHGDTFCTDDVDYMQFREKVRDPAWQRNILRLPRFVRKWKAKQLRKQSGQAKQTKSVAIMDVNQQTVTAMMKKHQVLQLIHGHTHRPGVHQFDIDGQPASRYVLGDWYQQGSVLVADNNGLRLLTIPLGEIPKLELGERK